MRNRVAAILLWTLGAFSMGAEPQTATENELRSRAEAGDAEAQRELGISFLKSGGSPDRAAYWLNAARQQRDPTATLYLGALYEQGVGVELDRRKAFECYQTAAAAGSLQAKYKLAQILQTGLPAEKSASGFRPGIDPDRARAAELADELLASGFIPAIADRAQELLDRPNLTENEAQWLRSTLENCRTSDKTGRLSVLWAECLRRGVGGEPDLERRFEVLEEAAPRSPQAETMLALALEYGEGCPPDPTAAFRRFQSAAERGVPFAAMRVGDGYAAGLPVKGDPVKAFELYQQALAGGVTAAFAKVGLCHLNGIGTRANPRKALECFLAGAERGDPEARRMAARCFAEGLGAPSDRSAAEFWLKLVESGSAQNLR